MNKSQIANFTLQILKKWLFLQRIFDYNHESTYLQPRTRRRVGLRISHSNSITPCTHAQNEHGLSAVVVG